MVNRRTEAERCSRSVVIAVAVVLGLPWLCRAADSTTVILVRHADKQSGENPLLTAEGEARAIALRQMVEDAGVEAVYATEWCRTALTAEPTAVILGLDLEIQDNGRVGDQLEGCGLTQATSRLDPSIATSGELVAHVLSKHSGGVVLIVGHSNTVPEMVEALGAASLCPRYFPADERACHIPDEPPANEYHHVFIVEVSADGGTRLIKAEYGDPS